MAAAPRGRNDLPLPTLVKTKEGSAGSNNGLLTVRGQTDPRNRRISILLGS